MGTNTEEIIFKDGRFIVPENAIVEFISPQEILINDWKCSITDKKVVCKYNEDKKVLKYQVFNNGFSRLTLKESRKTKILKKFWIANPQTFKFNGIIILSGGNISERYARYKKITD